MLEYVASPRLAFAPTCEAPDVSHETGSRRFTTEGDRIDDQTSEGIDSG